METIVIVAIAVVVFFLLDLAIYRLRTRISREKEVAKSYDCAFAGTVVADLVGYLVLRDSEDKLYVLPHEYAPNAKVGEILYAERVNNAVQNDNLANAVTFREYVISPEKDANRAQLIRRLNQDYALCLFDKTYKLVRCGVYEQIKYRKPVHVVAEAKSDGDDRQIRNCRTVVELPICETEVDVLFPICYPA